MISLQSGTEIPGLRQARDEDFYTAEFALILSWSKDEGVA
jgi:hypothetical protein